MLHLLYARFWHKVLYDLGWVSTREPFRKLFNQGMIQSFAYRDARGFYDWKYDCCTWGWWFWRAERQGTEAASGAAPGT